LCGNRDVQGFVSHGRSISPIAFPVTNGELTDIAFQNLACQSYGKAVPIGLIIFHTFGRLFSHPFT
jgi:hypothetical protein